MKSTSRHIFIITIQLCTPEFVEQISFFSFCTAQFALSFFNRKIIGLFLLLLLFFSAAIDETVLTPFIPKKIQLLTLVRNTRPTEFEKKSDGWEVVLKKAQNKGLYPLSKTWLDFYYEIWITNLDDTIVSKCLIEVQRWLHLYI